MILETQPNRLVLALLAASFLGEQFVSAQDLPRFRSQWKTNGFAVERFQIEGIGARNNPLRKQVTPAFRGDELFVRFRLRYEADSIDDVESGNGEFFVMWLDSTEGEDGSTHANQVPNAGIHVDKEGRNRFVVRYHSGGQRFAQRLRGDEDYLLVVRLWKSRPGENAPFDKLDLWINPNTGQENHPHVSTSSPKSISAVSWIGFSTGAKTEPGDKIEVGDIDLASTWNSILRLPPVTPGSADERSGEAHKKLHPKTVSFEKHVVPLLSARCFECHAGEDAVEGIRLDVLDETLNQISPRDSDSSRLIELVTAGEMPPEGEPLSADQIETLAAWIDEGLEWDEVILPAPVPETEHWSFQPIRRPDVPKVKRSWWIRTPVDAFIAAKHESQGIIPNPAASKSTLRRRYSLDMLGVPPSEPASEQRTDVSALLADPAYGQRWARYWLDLARWAESNGHQHNRRRPHAWRYRDWVIDAFNRNMPFDQFVRAQLAGDLIGSDNKGQRDSDLIATGFLAAARYSGNELSKDIQRNDILVDVANTTASAFLGLTMQCAQCHTHKFDPISIRDYYRFQAFFADGQPENVVLGRRREATRQLIDRRWEIFDHVHARMARIKRKQGHPEPIYVTPKSVIGSGMTVTEKREFSALERRIAELPQSWAYVAGKGQAWAAPSDIRWPLPRRGSERPNQTNILIRGDVKSKGPEVNPAWPIVFDAHSEGKEPRSRLDLANWIVDDRNPLAARVWANRIWQWHFGRGLVETSSDFGTQGTAPSHGELLDFLASELIESGWSTNHIHRLILNSSTYQLSNRISEDNAKIDPDNRLFWRWTPRRLDAEVIRDSILAISGQLDRSMGGQSVGEASARRSIYLRQERERFPHQQLLFDGAPGNSSCSLRRVSTSPLQSLWLLNSEFVQRAASKMAMRTKTVDRAFVQAIGRKPTAEERSQLESLNEEYGMTSVCLAILNSSEFVYLP